MYFYTKPALCAALLAVGCYFFTSRAIAQSDTTTVTTQSLTPITISSIKVGTQSASISDIDRSLRPVNTAQDLLRLVPGLFIAQHAGGGKAEQIFLRGFDCDHGTDFNISIDGMPVNMVSHAHGQGYADFHFVIPETVDRLRVYKGPYTTRFGDFATSGTGEFLTKNSLAQNEIKVEAGMFDTYRGLAMMNLLKDGSLFTHHKENAYIAAEYVFTNAYFDNKQAFGRFNIFGKYSAQLSDHNLFTFSASTFAAKWNASGQVPDRAIQEGLINRFGSIDPTEGGQTQRTNLNATLTTVLPNGATLKNQLYYVNYAFSLYSNFTFFLNDPVHGDQINQSDHRNIFGYLATYQKDEVLFGRPLHTTFGIGTRNDLSNLSLRHSEKRTVLDTIVSGNVYQQNSNAYADFTLDVTKRFSINAGLRYDYFLFHFTEDRHDSLSGTKGVSKVSPKLNFAYNVNDHLQLFVKSGMGFHSNDARSVVISHVTNNVPTAYGYEVGAEFKPLPRLLVNAALWGLYLENELVYSGDDGTISTNNPTNRLGVDLSARYQISDKFFLDCDVNYAHGRLVGVPEGKNYIPLAPNLTSIAGITYRQPLGFNASLRYRYIDTRPAVEDNAVQAKGYFIVDAVASYRFRQLEFGVSVENLLNRTWNQAQFDTESRLRGEPTSVTELHYTPGTPFFLKGIVSFRF